jgi:hypothetical protein
MADAMQCKNIIIIAATPLDVGDDEARYAIESLKKRYEGTRSVSVYKFEVPGPKLVLLDGKDQPILDQNSSPDTGVYVIAHGNRDNGFSLHNSRPLHNKAGAEALVTELLALRNKNFAIRKLCFLACSAVQLKKKENNRWGKPLLPKEAMGEHIFVQQMCQAISEIDTHRKLDNLMVAGYTSTVYVSKTDASKTFDKLSGTLKIE